MSALRVYRITHRKYADDAYSGKGGLHAAGRWSSRGRLVSYASESLALATLELIACAGSLGRLREMVYTPADLSKKFITDVRRAELPSGWSDRPTGSASRSVGDQWLEEKTSVALRVPSALLSEGRNYVLNPTHPKFDDAFNVAEAHPLGLDPRILDRLAGRE